VMYAMSDGSSFLAQGSKALFWQTYS